MEYIYDQFGIKRKTAVFSAANKLHALKKKSGQDPWPVIEECFKIWEKTHPAKYDSYLHYLKDIKATRKVTNIGNKRYSGVSKAKNGQLTSYVADMPKQVMYMIRAIYDSDELPMQKEFWQEFIWRYPKYAVREAV
ncbi:MAG TPA: hypothetical protein VF974_07515 [Patescibacteria group bacterium]